MFDFYVQHPRMTRIFLWEMAGGWRTYDQIAAQVDTSELEMMGPLLSKVKEARLLRSDFDPLIQVVIAQFVPMLFLACIPLFQMFMPIEGLPSPEAMARASEFIVEFVIRGLLADPPAPNARD